ncbi:sigma-E factor negative regulatory protein [Aeromonas simiae]|uniref:sigma-E factor negative regulatory protein n=1 Tax=Aeromonas simiae TaxID=218936 RepID=UPI00266C8066|nr:RseA family anti-sigma factor [Aeromonas simiae]MDO2949487.1 RseA family anti-sigma factor [Aeromonas simiae]MDO2953151.1 RseA family anti-sigma factor [Aeromonas simiae]MDO2956818.1 RseA family anti-sigma factor [Aeromonas simiae]
MANKEQLSALMDGELEREVQASLLDSFGDDVELQEAWSRYHLIGDTMRGELAMDMPFDLCDKIALALEDEPTVLAPQPAPAEPIRQRNVVVPFVRRVGQQFGQYAIAASVAAAVIFGVQQYQGQDHVVPTSPVLNTIPVGGNASPVSVHYPKDDSRARQQALTEQQMSEQRERINAFLRDHQLQQRLHQAQQVQE